MLDEHGLTEDTLVLWMYLAHASAFAMGSARITGSLALALSLAALTACGGSNSSGGGGGNPPPPAPSDFSLSVQPNSAVLIQGSSANIQVSCSSSNGFNGQVNVTITGVPSGVTATPASFTLSAASQQTVALTASPTATPTSATLSAAGTSGALSHTAHLALSISSMSSAMHPPIRTQFLRTDAMWDYGSINYFPQQWILYDPRTKRFFANSTALNRIDVFDATNESLIAQIPIPGPWVSDETPDLSTIYVGTQLGDLYAIDPVAMSVKKRTPAVEIGPTGYAAYEVRVLADGRLVLLGNQGGIPAIDGYANFGIWDPISNSLTVLGSSYGGSGPGEPNVCDFLINIAEFTLTADRTKVLISSNASDGTLCEVDPNSATYVTVRGGAGAPILVPPDGKEIIVAGGKFVNVYDSQGLFLIDQFQVGTGSESYRFILSYDGNTLYAVPVLLFGNAGLAIDWRTHAVKGHFSTYTTGDLISWTTPQAADPTGLISGVIGEGVSFLDASVLYPNDPGPLIPNPSVSPKTGPGAGGTMVTAASAISATRLNQVFFGNGVASGAAVGNGITVQSPPGNPGPVDVLVAALDGGLELSPEGFSYGPWVVEVTPDAATSEGSGTATIYGYGFGGFGQSQQPAPGLQVSIGGQNATIVQYLPTLATAQLNPWYPFPLQGVVVTVPSGIPGSVADVTVSTADGSNTVKSAFTYYPTVQQFPLSGAVLVQGIYDRFRDVYYFTDQTQVQVFSKAQGKWLAPIPITGAVRLWGISLSPDGTKLAIADAGVNAIYLLNPVSPSSVKTFSLPNIGMDQGELPAALAITDSGIIYYSSFYVNTTGGWAIHKLDTSSGNATDYQWLQAGSYTYDAYARVLLSSDNSRVYINDGGIPIVLDTATDTTYFNPLIVGDNELTLSSNGTWMSAAEYLADTNVNAEAYLVYPEREVWNVSAVYGEKLSPDGSLLFSPLLNAIDVLDGQRGSLLARISTPFTFSPNYDALVADGQDNTLLAITGQSGDGVAVIDLTSFAEPQPLPYARTSPLRRVTLPTGLRPTAVSPHSASSFNRTGVRETPSIGHPAIGIPHIHKLPVELSRQRTVQNSK